MFFVPISVGLVVVLVGIVLGCLLRWKALITISLLMSIAVGAFVHSQSDGESQGWAFIIFMPYLASFLFSAWIAFVGRNVRIKFDRRKT